MSDNAFLLRTSRILSSTPLINNLSCRNRSTWRRPIVSTTRLRTNHEPCISRGSVGDLDGIHASGRVLVPQLIRQLRDLGIVAVTQQRLYEGAIRIRVGRRGHQRIVQVDVDLIERRIQPIIHRTHGIGQVEVASIGSGHFRLNM